MATRVSLAGRPGGEALAGKRKSLISVYSSLPRYDTVIAVVFLHSLNTHAVALATRGSDLISHRSD